MKQSEEQVTNSIKDFNKTSDAISEVLKNMDEINQISSLNMRNTEKIATAANYLYNVGEKPNQMLIKFKT